VRTGKQASLRASADPSFTPAKTHFDTNHLLTIIWDGSDLEKAGKDLTATIRATLRAEARQTDVK